jgi:hypothetical protein
MKGKRIRRTAEERREDQIRSEALDRMLRDRITKIEAELRSKDPNYRGLDYWIEQVRAEREAKPQHRVEQEAPRHGPQGAQTRGGL